MGIYTYVYVNLCTYIYDVCVYHTYKTKYAILTILSVWFNALITITLFYNHHNYSFSELRFHNSKQKLCNH